MDGRALSGDHQQRLSAGQQGDRRPPHGGLHLRGSGGRRPGRRGGDVLATMDDPDERLPVEGTQAELDKERRNSRDTRRPSLSNTRRVETTQGRRHQCRGGADLFPSRRPSVTRIFSAGAPERRNGHSRPGGFAAAAGHRWRRARAALMPGKNRSRPMRRWPRARRRPSPGGGAS